MAGTVRVLTWSVGHPDPQEASLSGSWCPRFSEPMWNKSLDKFLRQSLRNHKLQWQLREVSQVTKPLWFGLWMDSPLSVPRCEILATLLSDFLPEEEAYTLQRLHEIDDALTETSKDALLRDGVTEEIWDKIKHSMERSRHFAGVGLEDLRQLIAALKSCAGQSIPFYVEMNPWGHVGLGMRTLFPHCPRCKAIAPDNIPRNSEIACPTCSFSYSPDETFSMTEMKIDRKVFEALRKENSPDSEAATGN